jgi:hypothetical protein
MHSSKKKTTSFVAMWDMTGLECLINVTHIIKDHDQWEKEHVWRVLKDQNQTQTGRPAPVPLNMMILRARANSQRHYEIYAFDSELTEKNIMEIFETDPQIIVDTIRNVGHKIYSDRADNKQQVIE